MLKRLVEFCLTRRPLVLTLLAVFMGAGLFAFWRLNIEAYPNPAPPILEIIAQNPGQSAEEIERYITMPIEIAVTGMPGLQYVRSISLYGLSFVRVQFSYDTEYAQAYQQTVNRLSTLNLPNNIQAVISPASLTGEIYRYELMGPPGYSLTDLKTLQDWVLERRFRTVPGVIDVVGWGGTSKEYHVEVDLKKLMAFNLTLPQVISAIGNSNINVGARSIQIGQQAANVRGIGLIESVEDINKIVLSQSAGTPILIRDVARTEVGFAPRLGIASRDGSNDVILGIVLMRREAKTNEVIQRVHAEVERINHDGTLPKGVRIQPYYDRSQLVNVTTRTVLHNLLFGILLIFFIQWLFLGDLRSAIIVAATIPFALFFSIIIMVMRGESANLLSVGAVDLGIIVDATVIMVENIFRHLREGGRRLTLPQTEHTITSVTYLPGKLRTVLLSSMEVDRAILTSAVITIAAFVPLFTMHGVEGQIFAPMAHAYGYALVGALIATFTISPALSSYLLPQAVSEKETWIVRHVATFYHRALAIALRHRVLTLAAGGVLLALTAWAVPRMGTEFLPHLEEGNLWILATLPPTISLEAGKPYVHRIREILKSHPEVVTVVSQHGRPDDGTDPAGVFNAEFFAPLKPFDEWPQGLTKRKLVETMQRELRDELPGVDFQFSQYIQDNIDEATSGVKGENSIKLFGRDLKTLQDKIGDIKDQMAGVRGIEDVGAFTSLGQPNLIIKVNRDQSARYGLAPGDVNAVVQAAIGGQAATDVFEEEKRFPLVVRLAPEYRQNVAAIRSIPVASGGSPATAYVPLGDVARIGLEVGASYIYRENNARYLPLKFSVRGRDLGSAVADAQDKVGKTIRLPDGYRIEWSGEFGALKEAQRRLAYIVPLSLLLIVVLLYSMFNSLRDSFLALTGIPFSVSGGILALYLTGEPFSVSAAVGFISLFGVSVMIGILMLTYYNQLRESGYPRDHAMARTAEVRMRPVLMMALSACIGLLPAAISTGIGSQVQRPLATVVVGGMLVAPVFILLVVPALWLLFLPKGKVANGKGEGNGPMDGDPLEERG